MTISYPYAFYMPKLAISSYGHALSLQIACCKALDIVQAFQHYLKKVNQYSDDCHYVSRKYIGRYSVKMGF
jgi:hypothetical protein